MRFLHLADLHLDTPFAGRRPELRERLRDATLQALDAAVERAIAEEVDAVLLAGDVFDGHRLSFRTERRLLDALRRLLDAGLEVVYATGNHDPGREAGGAGRIPWPDALHLVAGPEPRRIPIERDGRVVGAVTAAGHASGREGRDLSRGFAAPAGETGVPEVALLHTQVLGSAGSDAHDRYAPSELPALRRSGFDYWALGHVHVRQGLSADPPIHYPGNLQGRHPGESGPKGGLLVTLAPHAPAQVEFVELAPVRWETLRLASVAEAEHLEALVATIRRGWEEARREDPGLPGGEWLLRVWLDGPSPLHRELADPSDRAELERELRTALGLLDAEIRAEGVRPPLDAEAHRDRTDVLGEALALLDAIGAGEARPGELLGLEAADLAAIGDEDLDGYLTRLLDGEAPSLLAALLDPEATA